jgi:hypothetical protein
MFDRIRAPEIAMESSPVSGDILVVVFHRPRPPRGRRGGETVTARRIAAGRCARSVREVARAVQDVFRADFVEREGGNGRAREVQFGEVD